MQISKKQDNSKRPVTFRMSLSEYKNVSNLADELGLRRSQVIREAVHTFINQNQQIMFRLKKKTQKQQMRVQMNESLRQSIILCKLKAKLKRFKK